MPDERKEQEKTVVTVDGRQYVQRDGAWFALLSEDERMQCRTPVPAILSRIAALEAERAEIEAALQALTPLGSFRHGPNGWWMFAEPFGGYHPTALAALLAWHRQRKTTEAT